MSVFPGEVVRIEVPGEPKGVARTKARAVVTADGRAFGHVYTPTKTRNEMAVIRDFAAEAMAGRPPFENAIELRMSMFVSIPKSMSTKQRALALGSPPMLRPKKKPDFDNGAKFVDALKGIVWRDDAQISDAHVFKRYSDRPRLVIEVREIAL